MLDVSLPDPGRVVGRHIIDLAECRRLLSPEELSRRASQSKSILVQRKGCA